MQIRLSPLFASSAPLPLLIFINECLDAGDGASDPKSVLFCEEETTDSVTFHGTNIGPRRAKTYFGLCEALPIGQLEHFVSDTISQCQSVYLDSDENMSSISPNLTKKLSSKRITIAKH